ncbi:MAG: hypothetical protein WC880_00830 [Candidatus Paceibacterota bacterium]
MKGFLRVGIATVATLLPFATFAAETAPNDILSKFIAKIVELILTPILGLLFALALMYFVWGVTVFIAQADNPEERKKGERKMLWGIIGFFIMVSVIGILTAVTGTFGVSLPR